MFYSYRGTGSLADASLKDYQKISLILHFHFSAQLLTLIKIYFKTLQILALPLESILLK